MVTMLERFSKNKKVPKKTTDDHAEDALYREVWEEVNAQKTYEFVRKNSKILIAAGVAIIAIVIGIQIYHHRSVKLRVQSTEMFEIATAMMNNGSSAAETAMLRAAASSNGGMSDLALFEAAMNSTDSKIAILEKLSTDGATRDFRDLATIHLASLTGDKMSPEEFEKLIAPLLTKHSPYYFTGLVLVAQKYASVGDKKHAMRFIDKVVSDKDAPASSIAMAEMMK